MARKCSNCGFVERRLDKFSFEQFNIFWMAYPRKVGKGAAEKIWEKMKGDKELFDKIIQAVANQRNSEQWLRDNGVFIPHPATWLNQRRWEDEVKVKWVDPFDDTAQREAAAKKRMEEVREMEYQRMLARKHGLVRG